MAGFIATMKLNIDIDVMYFDFMYATALTTCELRCLMLETESLIN